MDYKCPKSIPFYPTVLIVYTEITITKLLLFKN